MSPQSSSLPSSSSTKRELAIFWDYENVVIPSRFTHPVEVSNAIVSAVSHYGRIVDRRMYMDFTRRRAKDARLWSALDSSGFDLVDTPARGVKETLDKKLIVDVLTFAWDSAVRNDNVKPVVVLLTSDGDYAYTLQKLRDRGVMAVVIYGNDGAVASILKAAADTALDFEADVLSKILSPAKPSAKQLRHRSSSFSSEDTAEDDPRVLVQVLLPLMASHKAISCASPQGSSDPNSDDTIKWVISANASSKFRSEVLRGCKPAPAADKMKERYRTARRVATAKGWILHGRRQLTLPGAPIVSLPEDFGYGVNKNDYSLEDFMSVTSLGTSILSAASPRTTALSRDENRSGTPSKFTNNDTDTYLFLKNISKPVTAKGLARYIEQSVQGVTVLRLNTRLSSITPTAPFCFAKVQLGSSAQAARVIEQGFSWRNRTVLITWDKEGAIGFVRTKGDFYFERQAGTPPAAYNENASSFSANMTPTKLFTETGKSDTNNTYGTYLYLKNVAKPVTAQELARHLEQSLMDVTIQRAMIPPNHGLYPVCVARIQVESIGQAQKVLEQSEKLSWRGRNITVVPDKVGANGYAEANPDSLFEKEQSATAPINTSTASVTSPNNEDKADKSGELVSGLNSSTTAPEETQTHASSVVDESTSARGFVDSLTGAFYEGLVGGHSETDAHLVAMYEGLAASSLEEVTGLSKKINNMTTSSLVLGETNGEEHDHEQQDSEKASDTNDYLFLNNVPKSEENEQEGFQSESVNNTDVYLFLKNVAKPVAASEIAECIQQSVNGVTVLRAAIRPGPGPNSPACFAKIQVASPCQAKLVLERTGFLEWRDRPINVLPDTVRLTRSRRHCFQRIH